MEGDAGFYDGPGKQRHKGEYPGAHTWDYIPGVVVIHLRFFTLLDKVVENSDKRFLVFFLLCLYFINTSVELIEAFCYK